MKEWQHGIEIEQLKPLAQLFKQEFKPYVFGAFGIPNERDVAQAIHDRSCNWTQDKKTCSIYTTFHKPHKVKDFTGEDKQLPVCMYVKHIAGDNKKYILEKMKSNAEGLCPVYVEAFAEDKSTINMLRDLGFVLQFVKIMAASEIKWVMATVKRDNCNVVSEQDAISIALLKENFISLEQQELIRKELSEYMKKGFFADHYSSYNKGKSWSAFALRGYDEQDPSFIEKPSEMSQKWKTENPHRITAKIGYTTAAIHFEQTLKMIDEQLKGVQHRVRFMKLAGNAGQLSRHADITDKEAGTADGKIVRLHIPIITHEKVTFTSWGLDGTPTEMNMAERGLYYLDTRKPHMAKNNSEVDRIHLVVDLASSDEIRKMLLSERVYTSAT